MCDKSCSYEESDVLDTETDDEDDDEKKEPGEDNEEVMDENDDYYEILDESVNVEMDEDLHDDYEKSKEYMEANMMDSDDKESLYVLKIANYFAKNIFQLEGNLPSNCVVVS